MSFANRGYWGKSSLSGYRGLRLEGFWRRKGSLNLDKTASGSFVMLVVSALTLLRR